MSTSPSSDGTLFASALERPLAERAAFLDEACAGDRERRARLDALLDAHEQGGDFLMTPVARPALLPRLEEVSGEWIDRYKLLLKIGEGGCGVVFMAEQEEPVRRRVALKVIKAGMDTREVIARFEAERQALALMDHPGICKVLDAGATKTGRPYFVMELVRGVPVTRYCDENQLSTRARLELFMQVCHAVQHAHQKGIIHRDLKPSNILVTQHGTAAAPKVIDFGIAKATQGRLTDATLVTAFEQFVGTPAYMSPEQAEMSALDIDTRSDVYSLGVLLYELLTGRPPFDPKSLMVASRDELRRIIREDEPPKPSTHLSTLADNDRGTVAKRRGTDPAKLRLQLSGDLDWIVMKALEKNRVRRYETPAALADDIARHLRDEPVVARPPGNIYRVSKFARRHRVGVSAAAAVVLVLLAGIIVSTWLAVRATRAEHAGKEERSRAVAARTRAEELLEFMLGDLRDRVKQAGKLDLLDMVGDRATAYFGSLELRELNDTTLLQQARTLRQIGEVQVDKARYAEASESFAAAYVRAAALVARQPKNGEMLFERAQVEFFTGALYRRRGDLVAASEWLTRYRESGNELLKMDPAKLRWQREFVAGLHNLAVLDLERGNLGAAQGGFVAEMSLLEKMAADNPGDLPLQFSIANVNSWLGTVAERSGDFTGAADRFVRQIRIIEALVGKDPLNIRWRVKLADALVLHTGVLSISGQRLASRVERTQARALFDALVAQDPANHAWLAESLAFRLREAMVVKADGDTGTAGQWVEVARDGLEKLASDEPTDLRVKTFLVMACWLEAELRHAAGRVDAADVARQGVSLGESLIRGARRDDVPLGEYANACIVAGRIAAAAGDRDMARQYWQRAADTVFPLVEASRNWRVLDPAARTFALLGRVAESRAVIERLRKLGYQPLEPWPDLDRQAFLSPKQ